MTDKETIRNSEFLGAVLQEPGDLGLRPDDAGWVNMCDLLQSLHRHHLPLTVADLYRVIAANTNRNLVLSEDGQYVRATERHPVASDLQCPPERPPEILHYGAETSGLDAIQENGLVRTTGPAVCLMRDIFLPRDGAQCGDAAILVVLAGDMHRAKHLFRRFTNNLWLVSQVPPQFIDFDAKPWPHLVAQLLKRHTREETFDILLSLVQQQRETEDFVYLEYALLAAGLLHHASEFLSKSQPDKGNAPHALLAGCIPKLLNLARTSPYPKIRARAISALPNLDSEGTRYGLAESLSDPAARALYAVKVGDRALFASVVAELTSDARKSCAPCQAYVLQVPPLTLSYMIEARGPCIEIGPGGPDQGERLPLTEEELYNLLRIPPTTSSADYSKSFDAILGDLKQRKHFTASH